MGKAKKFDAKPIEDFDWDAYEEGYESSAHRKANKSVKTKGKDKVYSRAAYAQELYNMYNENIPDDYRAKDAINGSVYNVADMELISDHEIRLDSNSGMSSIVDLNKENQFFKSVGCANMKEFVDAFRNDPKFKAMIIANDLRAKVMDNDRVSLWEGTKSKIEADFCEQLKKITAAYTAHVLEVNNGGYTVDISGVKCFLPGSLASAGPIEDFDALIGTDILVCIVNYSKQTGNFVVSYKKYLELTLPGRVQNELSIGQEVMVKVTGTSKNGIFCSIRDKKEVYTFPSLMHRTTMSPDMEEQFDAGMVMKGDMFRAYIHKINWNEDGTFRIVIGDKAPIIPTIDENEETEEKEEEK